MPLDRGQLQQITADYDSEVAAAARKRARRIAEAAAKDTAQKDIIEATGYSRESVRRFTREGQKILAEEAQAASEPERSTAHLSSEVGR